MVLCGIMLWWLHKELWLVSLLTPCSRAPELSVPGSWAQPCLVLAPGALLPLTVAPAALMPGPCGKNIAMKGPVHGLHGSGAKGFKSHPSVNHHGSCVGMAESGCHCSSVFPLPLSTGEAPESASVFPDMSASVLEIPEALHRGHSKQ